MGLTSQAFKVRTEHLISKMLELVHKVVKRRELCNMNFFELMN